MNSRNTKVSVTLNHSTGRGGKGGRRFGERPTYKLKSHTSLITKITTATFNTGHPKIEFQFKMSRRDIADYLTRTLESGHEVAMVLLKREEQTIKLPPRINKEHYT